MNLLDSLLEDGLALSSDRNVTGREVWIAIRADGARGSGTKDDPYDGSDRDKFDDRLLNTGAETVIHLGPGVFRTKGGAGDQAVLSAWSPRSGQKLIRSGMFSTILRLELNEEFVNEGGGRKAVSNSLQAGLTSYEISDLTIDSNADGQPLPTNKPYYRMRCDGMFLHGKNIVVRRVRVINWGSKHDMAPGTTNTLLETFPINLLNTSLPSAALSTLVEDCVVEQPSWRNARENTCITAEVVRNCFVDCRLVRPGPYPPMAVESISYADPTVTIITRQPHQLTTSDRIVVSGASPAQFNGNFALIAAQGRTLRYELYGASSPSGTILVEQESKPSGVAESWRQNDSAMDDSATGFRTCRTSFSIQRIDNEPYPHFGHRFPH